MQREVTIASVSWISRTPNPITLAVEAKTLAPEWVPKTCIGLAATSNPDPQLTVADFNTFRTEKNFRACTYCRLGLITDDKTGAVKTAVAIESWVDPGYTPPFSKWSFPSTVPGSILEWDFSVWDSGWYPGEASPLSQVSIKSRHPNSTITGVPASEAVLVNSLIKFRAGKHTDDLGINTVKCPFHVPWVWCETLITLAAGKLAPSLTAKARRSALAASRRSRTAPRRAMAFACTPIRASDRTTRLLA